MTRLKSPSKSKSCAKLARLLALMLFVMPLPACVTLGTPTISSTVCGPFHPIKYASKTKASPRYAGPTLATDLRVHNLTGKYLCGWKQE